ncbi:unnamed protein product [Symbiodinium pilosum]|uniref:Uncharacterized protein n=1 Tax=Symbiodinium pilosum TaxID=2952 RepID=A0A812USZ4_SYMPI|nr:unnamed protein product [Symbiodinium pilosum]
MARSDPSRPPLPPSLYYQKEPSSEEQPEHSEPPQHQKDKTEAPRKQASNKQKSKNASIVSTCKNLSTMTRLTEHSEEGGVQWPGKRGCCGVYHSRTYWGRTGFGKQTYGVCCSRAELYLSQFHTH